MTHKGTTRREFLRNLGIGAGAAALVSAMPTALGGVGRALARTIAPGASARLRSGSPDVELLVGDVLGFELHSNAWEGEFGWVKFRLFEAWFNGGSIYHIRTDASNPDYATENRLVWVPLLAAALANEDAHASFYTFANGADGQLNVASTAPSEENYTPAFHLKTVTFSGEPSLLTSAADVEAAAEAGAVTIEDTNIVVNFPIVKWLDGELLEDPDKVEALGSGPLVAPVDTENMEVNFKLHQCFPGSRYIITDTSAVPMAPMMAVPGSAATGLLSEYGAVDSIWVFGNGIPGPGVTGHQPAVFRNEPGTPTWSPFWDHYVITWNDPDNARILRNAADVNEALEAGEIEIWNGTPDTHPQGFVVNCPVPLKAYNDFGME